MKTATRDRLLALNRQFYDDVAEPFHRTRRSLPLGNVRLLDHVPAVEQGERLRVLDAGCGNGRFAAALNSLGAPVQYTGVDANADLLERAAAFAAEQDQVDASFIQADLADANWVQRLGEAVPAYDMVVCLSTLQHMPGSVLRQQVMRSLAGLVAVSGRLVVSAWQFLTSPRLATRRLAWATAGVDEQDVEPGDALLPWKQDVYAVRYVHQIDAVEMSALAAAAGLAVEATYFADGKAGNLNLYAVMRRIDTDSGAGPGLAC